jgi:GDP-mannose 6-dehydrogenase
MEKMDLMSRTISIFGLGYVGSVTSACLAHKGNKIIGVDINHSKVEILESGRAPVLEQGIEDLVAESHRAGRLHATTDATKAVLESEVSFVCVGTPNLQNGQHDLRQVERVICEIGAALRQKDGFHTVVLRSTVIPGTTESLVIPKLQETSGKNGGVDFGVCYNPEFLREGSAVSDFFQPTITVLGAPDPFHLRAVREIYAWVPGKVFESSLTTAETVKSICNAFHALKVVFANEFGTLCKRMGVDTEAVFEIFKSDTRLNASAAYLTPGFAFGGSCLPKDLRAVAQCARKLDLRLPVLESIMPSNNDHIERAVDDVLRTGKKKIGVLGMSFKTGTDDLRESPLVQFIKRLLGEGCQVRIWDRDVALGRLVGSNQQFIEEVIPHIGTLLTTDLSEVVQSSEVVIIGTRLVDQAMLAPNLRPEQIVIDLVNLERSRRLLGHSTYEGICW